MSQTAADQINEDIMAGLTEMQNQLSEVRGIDDLSVDPASGLSQDIKEYSERLEAEYGVTVSESERRHLVESVSQEVDTTYESSETAQRKEVLNTYTDAFADKFSLGEIPAEKRQELRPSDPSQNRSYTATSNENSDTFRIEAKTVALYW